MISGLQANTPSFLASLSNLETRLSKVNQEMTSGIRVNHASDDPSAVAPIVAYQGRIDYVKQIQANLTQAQAEVQTADSALQQATTLINQLIALGAQGASSTSDPATRAILAQKVQSLQQQLVGIANTAVNGHYTFGGDDSSTTPYTYNGSSPNGVAQNSTMANTQVLRDSDGNAITPRMTAQAIFDAPGASIFKAAFDLGTALLANNQTGIQAALNDLKTGADQLNTATTTYGNIESWITQSLTTATSHVNNLTQALSSFKDADIAAAATELSLDQTAMQAAIAANGSLRTRSLFDYLG